MKGNILAGICNPIQDILIKPRRIRQFSEKMSQKALYAVVQFSNDQTFSEVPTNWINRDEENNDLICWWPNTKNISSLIENRTEPDMKTWSMFDITVIKYCSSLASARKSAADSQYETTDDEKIGRGQRTLKKNYKQILHEIEENDDDDDLDDEGNNKENDDNSNERNKKSSKHLKQSINRPSSNPMPIYDPEKAEISRQSVNTCSTKKNLHFSTSTKNFETETLSSCSNVNKCSSNEIIVKKTVHSDKLSSPVTLDLDIPILEIPSVKDVYNILERIETSLDKIIRANVTTNFELSSISKRLAKLESCRHNTEPAENDMAMIIPLLPIKTVESIKEFDDLIKSNEAAASQFKKFTSKIGGNTPRINIHRALERTISNICAINCSWRGVRSNYKICDLTFIKIMRDVICSIHSGLTEAEFDITSAEWFRFAKQRAAREEKKRNL